MAEKKPDVETGNGSTMCQGLALGPRVPSPVIHREEVCQNRQRPHPAAGCKRTVSGQLLRVLLKYT